MGRKSRHVRDESDLLLGYYTQTMAETSSIRNHKNALYAATPTADEEEAISNLNGHSQILFGEASPLQQSLRLFVGGGGGGGGSSATSPSNSVIMNRNSSSTNGSSSRSVRFAGDHIHHDDEPRYERHQHYRATSSSSYRSNASSASAMAANKKNKKKKRYRVHRVSYTAQNHVQVLFRMYGSAFPQVLPFCLVNVVWTFVIHTLRAHNLVDLTFHSSVGHSFMGLLVSFLIVSRSKISYDRFMDFRRHLSVTYRTSRQIAQFCTVYSFGTKTPAAMAWRQEVCYRTILLLQVTMDTLLWSSTERDQWEDEYFRFYKSIDGKHRRVSNGIDNNKLRGANRVEDDDPEVVGGVMGMEPPVVSDHFFHCQQLSHGRRSMIDENIRAPITFQHVLQRVIMEHPQYLGYKLAVNEYRDLLSFVDQFSTAFHDFRVLIFTPYPFPLVQMTRAFLLFWVYTLPMVLLKDYRMWSSLLIVLLVTFGFVGIEYVSMALDDPFGDDTNDVDEHGMALLVYEDIYLSLYRTDGPAAAFALRERVLQRYKQGRGLDCYRRDLQGYAIWEPDKYNNIPQAEDDDDEEEDDDDADDEEEKGVNHNNRKNKNGGSLTAVGNKEPSPENKKEE